MKWNYWIINKAFQKKGRHFYEYKTKSNQKAHFPSNISGFQAWPLISHTKSYDKTSPLKSTIERDTEKKERNYSCHSWFSSVLYQLQVAVLDSSFNLSQLSQLHSTAIKNWAIFTLIASTLLIQQENHQRFLATDLLIDLCQTPLLCHDSICQGVSFHINYLKTPASPGILNH